MKAEKKRAIIQGAITALLAVAIMILTITFSIGLPIYFRPFYYMQIGPLELVEDTGWSREVIIEAYNEVLDFCTLPGGEFSAGELKFSEEGAGHFADCKKLFSLNAWGLIISLAVVVTIIILKRRGVATLSRPFGLGVGFWSGLGTLSLFALLGGIVSIDFDKAFEVFHSIFFPGKDNWLFNPWEDEIIRVMPQDFFMNCAILIVSSIILISLILMIVEVVRRKRNISK